MSSSIVENNSRLIKEEAYRLGFSFCGMAKAEFLEDEAPKLEHWLKKDYHGEMAYMANHFDKRLDPTKLVEGSKSVVSLMYNYYPEQEQKQDSYKIAKYAYGKDYHHVIKDKLKELMHFIRENIGEVDGRAFVDSAPVMERAWAEKAGLGWLGKHTLLINKGSGSFFFLAELIIDLELAYDNPYNQDYCGTCTRCIDACPTDAIVEPNLLDGSKCISYFTIELKGEIPTGYSEQFNDWMFGCDICQDVCPWNRFSKSHNEEHFEPHPDLLTNSKQQWEEVTQELFNDIFRKSAVKRTKFEGLKRNITYLKNK